MRRSINQSKGVTLLELLVAVSVTALSVLGIASLQGSALRVNRQTGQTQEATHLVKAELAVQRERSHSTLSPLTGQACVTSPNCQVDSYPCSFSARTLRCGAATLDASELVAHQVVVSVQSADASPFSLYTVVRQ